MKIFKRTLLVLGALLIVLLIWGLAEPYFVKVKEEEAAIPNLPESWEDEQIAVIGDFQIGMWLDNDSTVEKMAEQLVDMNPRAVLLMGDYVYHSVGNHEKERKRVMELIKPLTDSDIPVFALLGNHDYNMPTKTSDPDEDLAQDVKSELEQAGIRVLQNESIPLTLTEDGLEQENASAESLYLVGLGAEWPGNAKPIQAFEDVPDSAARFVMMHNPQTFGNLQAESAPVSVAGHTHGGQIRVPGLTGWSYTTFKSEDEFDQVYGWTEDYGAAGNQLYINSGVGFSGLPLRINCPPEITVFTLKAP